MSGGGLDSTNKWTDKGNDFFLPIKVISKKFRGKFLSYVKTLNKEKRLEFHGMSEKYRNGYEFQELIDICYKKEWIPYSKKTFNGAESAIEYLGRYTHRIAISNHRIISIQDGNVTFSAKDYRHRNQWKELTITEIEFIRRFK